MARVGVFEDRIVIVVTVGVDDWRALTEIVARQWSVEICLPLAERRVVLNCVACVDEEIRRWVTRGDGTGDLGEGLETKLVVGDGDNANNL